MAMTSTLYFVTSEETAACYGVYTRRRRYGANFNLFRPVETHGKLADAREAANRLLAEADAKGKPIDVSIQAGRGSWDHYEPYQA